MTNPKPMTLKKFNLIRNVHLSITLLTGLIFCVVAIIIFLGNNPDDLLLLPLLILGVLGIVLFNYKLSLKFIDKHSPALFGTNEPQIAQENEDIETYQDDETTVNTNNEEPFKKVS